MPNEKVKVSIKLNKAEMRYEVVSSHPLPTVNVIVRHLPTGKKRDRARGYGIISISNLISYTSTEITLNEWSDAIAKATMGLLNMEPVETEIVAAEGGYLSIGKYLFKVSATDYLVGGQHALPVLRRRVMDDAKVETAKIIEKANVSAAKLIKDGETVYLKRMDEAQTLRNEVARLKKEASCLTPSWFAGSGLLFKQDGDQPKLGVTISVYLRRFVYTDKDGYQYTWWGKENPSVSAILWFPYNASSGEWKAERVGCSLVLPHIDHTHACFMASTMPPLTNAHAVKHAAAIVEDILTEMNMNSPFCNYSGWEPSVRAFVPEKLKDSFEQWEQTGYLRKYVDLVKKTADETNKPADADALIMGAEPIAQEFHAPEPEPQENDDDD